VAAFPDKLRAIQQGDNPTDNATAMGRPALHVRVRIQGTDIDLIAAHFKSKLLTFPPTDSAPTTRASAPGSVPTPCTAVPPKLSPSAPPPRPSWPPPRSSTARPGQRSAPAASTSPTTATDSGCGSGPKHPRSPTLQPHLSGTRGTDRPHLREPRARKRRGAPGSDHRPVLASINV